MKALKRNVENLQKVVDSICIVDFSSGSFILEFLCDDFAVLVSRDRTSIGSAICSLIPFNWSWHVVLEDDCLKLCIWL